MNVIPCPRCMRDLPSDAFGVSRNRKTGRNLYCKECRRNQVAAARAAMRLVNLHREGRGLAPLRVTPQSVSRKSVVVARPRAVDRVVHALNKRPGQTILEIKASTKLKSLDEVGEVLAELYASCQAKPIGGRWSLRRAA